MDPLSPWTYARRNGRRILPTLIILTFVVMLVVVILSVIEGLKDSTLVYTREFDHWTILFPKKDTRIPKETLAAVRGHPAVERVMDSRNAFIRVKTLIGPVPYHLRAAKGDEIQGLLDRVGATLTEGTLPKPGTSEVALHESLMASNGWSVGAEFGMEVNEEDWMPGRFRVVGVLRGPVPLGICSFEYLNSPLLYTYSAKLWERVIVVAKPGRLTEANVFLRGLSDVKAWDKRRSIEEVSQSFDRISMIFTYISGTLIVVVALVTGLIHNLFFAQRIDEFAVLLAIGHTKRRMFRRVAGEAAAIMTVSWAGGVALALGLFELFRRGVLLPRGIPVPFWHPGPIAISAALPLVALAFATITVVGRLRRLDPVAIIERRG